MLSEEKSFLKFSNAESLVPQEEMLEISKSGSTLTIGVPGEISFQEKRVPLVPQAAGLLVANGHKVIIERGAGKSAHFSDAEYSESGATIVDRPEEVYKSDIILKVAPPLSEEIDLMRSRQIVFSSLHITGQNKDYFKKLMAKKITGIAYEYIKDKGRQYPVIRSMSEIVGTTSIFIAAEYLSHAELGKGVMLGGCPGVTPTEVVIIGAGTVGEYASRAALGLGATVRVFDNSVYRLRRMQNNLNTRIFTSILQSRVLAKSLASADVVIGAMRAREGMSPCVVPEELVEKMKYGSVIIDVSIDQGGCFETSRITSHKEPVFKKHDVIHYCVPNIASSVPHTASYALSNFFAPIILKTGEMGGVENLLKKDFGVRQGVYLFNGISTNKMVSDKFHLPFQDIELLIVAFR